ncbi:DUF5330 domain-containing protein [Xanthobacter sp. KR7-65]|uniref:DUF5330 domain-containing protein n=1 Tax=Xanthobacter sp. KR7-65 TaxID=3156612 RepID=UPI0032B49519
MFFLLRLVFWLGLVLLLLPFGLKGNDGRDVSVFDALGAAQALFADLRGFCDRQPQACAVGGQMAGHLAEKAQVGAKWVYEAIGRQEPPPGAVPGPAPAPTQGQSGALDLTPQDLMPMWGGGDAARLVVPQGFQPATPTAVPAGAPGSPPGSQGVPPLPPRRPA